MNLGWIDQIVLFSYLAGVIAFGCYFSRGNTSSRRFMDAGGELAGWVVGLSIFGTYLSSISFLANPGKSFAANWSPFVFSLSLPLAAWIACRWFVPFYRKRGEVSAYSHLEKRFGRWARNYAVVCYLLTQFVRIGAILLLVAMAINRIVGFDVPTIIVGIGIAVMVYTLVGGIEAVIWTDVVQSIVLTVGILVAIVVVCVGMPGGPRQIIEIARESDKFSLGSFGPGLSEPTFWVVLIYGLAINLQNFGIDQSYVQRYATARNESQARRSVWIACWLYLPVSALLFFVGTAVFAFYEVHPDRIPAGFRADEAFGFFIANEFPVGLIGLLIAAIMAAAMSSIDSSLNSCATLICTDVVPQFSDRIILDSAQMERRAKKVLTVSTVVIGGVGMLIGIFLNGTESILDAWWKLAGIFSGGMLGLFLLGLMVRQSLSSHAAIAVLLAIVLILWMSVSPIFLDSGVLRYNLHANLIIVFGTMTILFVGYVAALFGPRSKNG